MNCQLMLLFSVALVAVWGQALARDGKAIWDSRCEECHSEPDRFARKFLWNIDGQLQGQHHVDDLPRFMSNHYVPRHEMQPMQAYLLSMANSMSVYQEACESCHGEAKTFVKENLWVTAGGITSAKSGRVVSDFLPGHEGIAAQDSLYFLRLFARMAGERYEVDDVQLPEPVLR